MVINFLVQGTVLQETVLKGSSVSKQARFSDMPGEGNINNLEKN